MKLTNFYKFIPNKLSELTNDTGFISLSSQQFTEISGTLDEHVDNEYIHVTQLDKTTWTNKAPLDSPNFVGIPTVPTYISGNNQQIINIESLHNILGDIPVIDDTSLSTWIIPNVDSTLYKTSKIRLGTLYTKTNCYLTISKSYLTKGNTVILRADNQASGSLIYGDTEIIKESDVGIWLLTFANLNGKIELIGQKQKITFIQTQDTPLTFTAMQDNSTVKLVSQGSPDPISLQYSKNDSDWINYTLSSTIQLNKGQYVSFIGTTNTLSKNDSNYYHFIMSGKIQATGNTNSLINYSQLTSHCYCGLFKNCISLYAAAQLPATTLANCCYIFMFNGCENLISTPDLPATTLAYLCYGYMFEGCSNLINVSQLPATTLTMKCYYRMYKDCISLVTASYLPATTLAFQCYNSMYEGCTSLSSVTVNFEKWS